MKALILFAKEPIPGEVKTRLTPFLSPNTAAELYHCMLMDTLAKVRALEDVALFLFYDGGETAASFFRSLAADAVVVPQRGGDLGERMRVAFADVFSRGYQSVVIIGSDSPDLPRSYMAEAFVRLDGEHVDVVFGPSDDGGYYLLGLKDLHPQLFEGIAWSSPSVLGASLTKAVESGLQTTLLSRWYDLDVPADLFRPHLMDPSSEAPCTRSFLLQAPISTPPADIPADPGNLPFP